MANSYLNKTLGTPSNTDKMTISAWVKRSKIGASQVILGEYADTNNRSKLRFRSGDEFEYFQRISGATDIQVRTNRVFRDVSAWYHILVQIDTSLSTANDRIKFYINGIQESAANLTYSTPITQNRAIRINKSGLNLHIGQNGNSDEYLEGYISHIALVDNAIVAPTSFGETDSTSGIWKFKQPSGLTWGNNGFHLKFENSGNLGLDSSGQTNNFTANGNLKQSLDTPSNVYNTLNPNYQSTHHSTSRAVLANGNTKWTATTNNTSQNGILSTLGASSGKWYLEAKWKGTYDASLGVAKEDFGMMTAGTGGLESAGWYGMNTNVSSTGGSGMAWYSNNSATGDRGNTISTNDIIMMAIDLDNSKLYFGKNGTWEESGDPTSGATGTGATSTLASNTTYIVACGNYGYSYANSWEFNFGNGFFGTTAITSAGSNGNGSLFEYDVPSGYYALNTKNINTYG